MSDPIRDGMYPAKILIYGNPGAKKSTFAATAQKPLLVSLFDPIGKDMPYMRAGRPQPLQVDEAGLPYREVFHRKKDEVIIRVEYFHDRNVKDANQAYAFERYLDRLDTLEEEICAGQWASYCLDSLSTYQLACFHYNKYKKNPRAKSGEQQDARQWYGAVAAEAQEIVNTRMAWLPIPVIFLAHVSTREHKELLTFLPDAPGQTSHPNRLPAAFTEVWYADVDENGHHWLQTQLSDTHLATTQVNAPNPMEPHWKAFVQAAAQAFGEEETPGS